MVIREEAKKEAIENLSKKYNMDIEKMLQEQNIKI